MCVIVILLRWTWVSTKEVLEVLQTPVNEFRMSITSWGPKVVKELVMMNISGPKWKGMEFQGVCWLDSFEPWSKKTVDFHVEGFSSCQLFCSTDQEKSDRFWELDFTPKVTLLFPGNVAVTEKLSYSASFTRGCKQLMQWWKKKLSMAFSGEI